MRGMDPTRVLFSPHAATTMRRITVARDGGEPDRAPEMPQLSADGTVITFTSMASKMGDSSSGRPRVLRSTQGALHTLPLGREPRSFVLAADGRHGAFVANSGAPKYNNGVYLFDEAAGSSLPLTPEANHVSSSPAISADGACVAFSSVASNLVPGDNNGHEDVFVWQAGTVQRVSVDSSGAEGDGNSYEPDISADGRFVTFTSTADLDPHRLSQGLPDVYVRDRLRGETRCISRGPGGEPGNLGSSHGRISSDGRYVVFSSFATNLEPGGSSVPPPMEQRHDALYVHDCKSGETRCITRGFVGPFGFASLSNNGFVAFSGHRADDGKHSQIYVYDVATRDVARVSSAPDGAAANADCIAPCLSDDGNTIAFVSGATNLVPGEGSYVGNAFVTPNPSPRAGLERDRQDPPAAAPPPPGIERAADHVVINGVRVPRRP